MDDAQKRSIRDKILNDIRIEGIDPKCNKRQIEQAIENVVAHRSVAANRKILNDAIGSVDLPVDMQARVLAAVFREEEASVKEATRLEQPKLDEGVAVDGKKL